MIHYILEKAQSHKYIKRTGSPGQYSYTYRLVRCPRCKKDVPNHEIIWDAKTHRPSICYGCYEKIKEQYFPKEKKEKPDSVVIQQFLKRQEARLKEAGFDEWPDSDVKKGNK